MISPDTLPDSVVRELALPEGLGNGLALLERGLLLDRLLTLATHTEAATSELPADWAALLNWVVATLLALDPDEAIARLGSPRAMAWLGRLGRAMMSARPDAAAICALLGQAPVLLAGMSSVESEPVRCTIELAPGTATAPLGAPALLRNNSGKPLRLNAIIYGGAARFLLPDGSEVATISDDGAAPRGAARGPAAVERIQKLTVLGVELLEDADYPELAGSRGPNEMRCGLTPAAIECELAPALMLIAHVWPAAYSAVRRSFRGLLPITMPNGNWNSASTNHLPFVLQVTLREHSVPILLAESIVHESSHVRIDLARSIAPLLRDDGEKRFFHPWRPDPRPITGVLLGAHAFLAVLELYRRAEQEVPNDPMIGREIESRTREVGAALRTLEDAPFTPLGARLFAVMAERYREGVASGVR